MLCWCAAAWSMWKWKRISDSCDCMGLGVLGSWSLCVLGSYLLPVAMNHFQGFDFVVLVGGFFMIAPVGGVGFWAAREHGYDDESGDGAQVQNPKSFDDADFYF